MEDYMKIFKETMEGYALTYALNKIAPLEHILFLDIETTGFAAKTSCLYLIGCAYYLDGNWHTIQWLAEDMLQESAIISAFLHFSVTFKYLIHFNGSNFDLPFMRQKCVQWGLSYDFGHFRGIDLYKAISPYKFFLKLPNCKQKTLEQFLGVGHNDVFTGVEQINIYQEYCRNPSEYMEKALFMYNANDLKGMLDILPMLAYYDLLNEKIKAKKVQANYYRDFADNKRKELLMHLSFETPLPKPISSSVNHCYFRGEGMEGSLRVPIYEEEMKYFYSNYKDYYYLPTEDVALHKSVASFVDREHRIRATAASCYTRKYSSYLPQWDYLMEPLYRRDYKSGDIFFELTDELKKNRPAFNAYAKHVLNMIATTY
jgi:uncharacterized protein YprB with RNaseH-like and TPR domain